MKKVYLKMRISDEDMRNLGEVAEILPKERLGETEVVITDDVATAKLFAEQAIKTTVILLPIGKFDGQMEKRLRSTGVRIVYGSDPFMFKVERHLK